MIRCLENLSSGENRAANPSIVSVMSNASNPCHQAIYARVPYISHTFNTRLDVNMKQLLQCTWVSRQRRRFRWCLLLLHRQHPTLQRKQDKTRFKSTLHMHLIIPNTNWCVQIFANLVSTCSGHGLSHRVMATMLLPRAMEYVNFVQGDLSCTRVRNSAITRTYSSSTLAKDPTDRTAHISVYMAAPYCQGDTPPRVPAPVGIHYQTPNQHNNICTPTFQ